MNIYLYISHIMVMRETFKRAMEQMVVLEQKQIH